MNDGEELFLEQDSLNGKSWRLEKSFYELNNKNIEHNIVIVAVHSAKRFKGRFFDDTRRYIELFPKEAIDYFEKGQKKNLYSSLSQKSYPEFLVTAVLPFLEDKFQLTLNKNNLGVMGSSMGCLLYTSDAADE